MVETLCVRELEQMARVSEDLHPVGLHLDWLHSSGI